MNDVSILRVRDLSVRFGPGRRLQAVSAVDLDLGAGEVLAVVGESGSGKSTLARTIVGLQRPTSGTVEFVGRDAQRSRGRGRRRRSAQMVFQNPRAALNPRLTVRQIIAEAFHARDASPAPADHPAVIAELLHSVGLDASLAERTPAQLSGGQCQRVSIARALAAEPDLLVCDEVVSALDVSIQAQIIQLLRELNTAPGVAMLFITHDLGVVRQLADRVAVMYLGKVMEIGDADTVFTAPTHPYTQSLIAAAVDLAGPREGNGQEMELAGAIPNPSNPPSGCRLHTRCWKAAEVCARDEPPLTARGDGLVSACHFAEPVDVLGVSVPTRSSR